MSNPQPILCNQNRTPPSKTESNPSARSPAEACECVSDQIRKNPISSVLGAAVFGAAVCYLILEGRHQPTFRERYVSGPLADAGDSVSDTFRSAFDNLKFW